MLIHTVIECLHDSWMVELRQRVKLALEERQEPASTLLIRGFLQTLERESTLRRAIEHLLHARHTPDAQSTYDLEASLLRARRYAG